MNIKVLVAVLVLLAVAGCTKSSMSPDSKEEAKEYAVSLSCGGEITDVSISDLTKAEEINDLYGVQVYSRPAQSEDAYKPYAYGLFDSMEGREIKLLDGYEYKFVATMVKDGKTILYQYVDDSYFGPFSITPTSNNAKVSFVFTYDSYNYFRSLGGGYTQLKTGEESSFNHPNTDR